MKTSPLLALLVIASTAFAGPPGDFAPDGRILTIGQGGEEAATVWAIQEDQIVIYRVFGYYKRTDELVTTKPITPDQRKAILDAVRQIPRSAYGHMHTAAYTTHAPFLRLCFTQDGSLSALKMIEIEAHVPLWLDEIISTVSSICQPEASITYPQAVAEYQKQIPESSISNVSKYRLRDDYRPAQGLYDPR